MKKAVVQFGTFASLAAAVALAAACSSGGPQAAAAGATPEPEPAPVADPGPAASAAMASISAAQVDRGETVFDGSCTACHSVSEMRGNTFLYSWRRRTAWDLYRQIAQTMPEDAPGSLEEQEYVDVVAYILRQNGHRPGDGELAATEESLSQLPVDASEMGTDGGNSEAESTR